MDYSIIIPVFNKAELTRNCLSKLRPSLEGAGVGEVIVIDNASTDHTQEMLADFPWIRMVRNESNLGFSGANNQGARLATGKFLVLLNNDTEAITTWLAPMLSVAADPSVGAVGARLLFADRHIQHAGVVVRQAIFGAAGFIPYHYLFHGDPNDPEATQRRDYQVVTGACLVTPRDLYLELGGLDEGFWNGYEDVDYCFKVRERGLRVVYEPQATLYHFESQSGSQRFRRTHGNVQRLSDRWRGRIEIDAPRVYAQAGMTVALSRSRNGGLGTFAQPSVPVEVLVHGYNAQTDRKAFEHMLAQSQTPLGTITWARPGDEIATARSIMAIRGERFVAFVRGDTQLDPGWLDELLGRVASVANAAAATFSTEVTNGSHVSLLASDARCVVLRLRAFPQHMELLDCSSLDASVADLLLRSLDLRRGSIGSRPFGALGAPVNDAAFESSHGFALSAVQDRDPQAIERQFRKKPAFRRGLVSIVTLSWNAPEYTLMALRSIATHTAEPYEVIVVDNGSKPETIAALKSIDDSHVRIIYNQTNRGFSGGNNDGIAHALGDYVIVLNNDVIVTPGWADDLVNAFSRIPGLGISAPRSNVVVGDQKLPEANYKTEEEMFAFAAGRRREFSRSGYLTDRAVGFCWCISREALDSVGALDERFTLGNFEDDDYCMRVRAAGYWIYVCDDVFIHHFGSRSFVANNVDYGSTMETNWKKFALKWGFSGPLPAKGYSSAAAHRRGFDRAQHFLPFPSIREQVAPSTNIPEPVRESDVVFAIAVREERDWTAAAQFVKRFAQAFRVGDPVRLSIAALGDPDAATLAGRVERILDRAGVALDESGEIDIEDFGSDDEWAARWTQPSWTDISAINDRSPSALRRFVQERKP